MPSKKLTSNFSKRKTKNAAGPLKKKSKRRDSVDSDLGPLKIIGVNDDCLEHIFEYLNATELNNVASAHPRLVPAARLVFKRKYSDLWICLRQSGRVLSIFHEINESDEIVNATLRSFLEHFGKLLLKLDLDYENKSGFDDEHHWREIEGLIFEHCTETLTQMCLRNCRGNVMEEIQRPFKKVDHLFVDDGFTERTKVDFDNWFPNIRNLQVREAAVRSAECMKGRFGFVQRLELQEFEIDDVVEGNIRKLIQINPHIRELIIHANDNAAVGGDFFTFLTKTLKQLRTLYIVGIKIDDNEPKHIHFANVERFSLESVQYPNNITITFDQLKYLDLWNVPSNPKWLDFILENKGVTTLLYDVEGELNVYNLIKIVKELPKLNTLRFWSSSINLDYVIELLNECKLIKNLKTIGKLMYDKENFKDEVSRTEQGMDQQLKRVYGSPILKPYEEEFSVVIFHTMDFCRKSN